MKINKVSKVLIIALTIFSLTGTIISAEKGVVPHIEHPEWK